MTLSVLIAILKQMQKSHGPEALVKIQWVPAHPTAMPPEVKIGGIYHVAQNGEPVIILAEK